MTTREEIEQALEQLEKQRALIGDLAVDAGIRELKRQLMAQGETTITTNDVEGSVMTGQTTAGNDIVGRDKTEHHLTIITEQGVTVVQGELDIPMQIDQQSVLGQYVKHLIAHHGTLPLQGIHSGGKQVHIPLEHIYITLRATRQRATHEEAWLEAESQRAPGERDPRHQPEMIERLTIHDALAQHRRLVVLGDPGSGKTTLLRYLALIYARDLADESTEMVQKSVGVSESGYLPLWLPLRYIGAFLSQHGDVATEGHRLLLDFYRTRLQQDGVSVPADFFVSSLTTGRAIVLLDGLDEVADPKLRQRVARLVENLTRAYPDCRYVVTSRVVGYGGAARLGAEYTTTTVRDFTLANIRAFLERWHQVVAIKQMGQRASAERFAQQQTEQLLTAIEQNTRIRELAINPLMLTVIALVHRDRVKLPDRRAELYAEAIDVLLGKWDEAKIMPSATGVLADRPFDAGDKRLLLQQVALHMHEKNSKEIEADALRRLLHKLFLEMVGDTRAAERATTRFLQVIQERTGLLVARGEGVYGFSHLTFQEYLVAQAVAEGDDYVDYVLAKMADSWWRETILLIAGYLSMFGKRRTTRLIEAIATYELEPEPYHNLVLAADCLRDVGETRILGNLAEEIAKQLQADIALDIEEEIARQQQQAKTRPIERKETIWTKFWRELRPPETNHSDAIEEPDWDALKTSLIERKIAAATALGRLYSGQKNHWQLPYGEPDWVTIPAGSFWMGSEDGAKDEQPKHQLYLPSYQIARVPVTNAQYLLFVQASGHSPPNHWQEGQIPKGLESYPVTYVTWHDAMAYCGWLSEVTGKQITLPSEAEWEKAARGTAGQLYPWQGEFDRLKCNGQELGIGTTTPVGIFPQGASPYGVLDMSGNVWEWTRTNWGYSYPYVADDGREDMDKKSSFVLRGGAYWNGRTDILCSYRYRDSPDFGYDRYGFRVIVLSP